jgi:hypothetical protein
MWSPANSILSSWLALGLQQSGATTPDCCSRDDQGSLAVGAPMPLHTKNPMRQIQHLRPIASIRYHHWICSALTGAGSTGKMENRGHKSVDFLSFD